MSCVAFSIVDIFSISVISKSWILYNKFDVDKYFQINLGVSLLGSNVNSGFVLWARWKSKIEFSETSLFASSIYPNK